MSPDVSEDKVVNTMERLDKEAEEGGYHLNPDKEFVKNLIKGLLTNEERYGYMACPCRLASGNKDEDLDLICPCDYRDQDLVEYDACYCALYVDDDVKGGRKEACPIPDRRPPPEERQKMNQEKVKAQSGGTRSAGLPYPVWRCKVCGYLCGRESPPSVCPICKAKKERFERFM
jgi:ferredoxin-thioredoxin reductase catalytic subunit